MSVIVEVWSDIHCPWATVAVQRLRRARDELGLDVTFSPRPWPLEWVNEQGTPRQIVEPETAALASHEPELFSRFRGESWPSTFLPAFELIAAARRVAGERAAEDVDYGLRVAFFRQSADVSLRHELRAVAEATVGEAAGALMDAWANQAVRADVTADYERSKGLPIQGSPQIFWPDGETTHNPGMTDHEFVRGLPRIHSTDPDAPARLLREHLGVT